MTATSTTDNEVRCECGTATGYRCDATVDSDELVIVEWMPEWLRASHRAAGNSGTYPHNGAERFLAARECADLLCDADPEWCHKVQP